MRNHALLIFLLTLICGGLAAQPNQGGQIDNDTTIFIKEVELQLEETEKFKSVPELPEIKASAPDLNFEVPDLRKTIANPAPDLKPQALSPKQAAALPNLYNLYLKAGFGMPLMPFVDASYHNGKSERFDFGAALDYHSGNSSRENQQFARFGAKVNGTRYFSDAAALGGSLSFRQHRLHYYGYESADTSFTKDEVFQRFNTIVADVQFFRPRISATGWDYAAKLDLYRFFDLNEAAETGLGAAFSVKKQIGELHTLKLEGGLNYVSYNDETGQQPFTLPYFKPTFTFVGGIFRLKGGGFLAAKSEGVFISPVFEAIVNIAKEKFTLVAGWDANAAISSLRPLAQQNPWTVTAFVPRSTFTQERYIGLKGNIRRFGYEVRVAQLPIQNAVLFLNDSTDFKRFTPVFDTLQTLGLRIAAHYEVDDKLSLLFLGKFNSYNPEREERAWHLPAGEAQVSVRYHVQALWLKVDLFSQLGMPYRDEAGLTQTLPAIFDANLGAEYFFAGKSQNAKEHFGLFLALNNIANLRNQRWYRYPTFGFNFLAGFILKW